LSSIYKPSASTHEKQRQLGKARRSQQPQQDSLAQLSAPYDDKPNPIHSDLDSLYQSTDKAGRGPQNILYHSRDAVAVGHSLQSSNLTQYCRTASIKQQAIAKSNSIYNQGPIKNKAFVPESCSPVRVSHIASQLASTRKSKTSEVPAKQLGVTPRKADEWGDGGHNEQSVHDMDDLKDYVARSYGNSAVEN
jgi:hypothetical protein